MDSNVHFAMKPGFSKRAGWTLSLKIILIWLVISPVACQSKESTVTLAFLGDLMLGRSIVPTLDSLAYLSPDISTADLTLANLESPLAPIVPTQDSIFNLCTLSTNAGMLNAWGLDLLSLANNHSLDCNSGKTGDSRSALLAAGITSIGPGMEPVYREVNDLQLAFLAFEDLTVKLDGNAAAQAIRSARDTGALVIVSVHWGAEYQSGVSERQKSLANQFAQAGATLIWGHHPHVLQPAEWIETRSGQTFILYSLGNALFDQVGLEDTHRSALIKVILTARGVASFRIVPFVIDTINSRVVQPDTRTIQIIQDRLKVP
jgi:poly-gamma-glutamate synthesis protein (capsule biosynthesis protein)